MLQHSNVQFKIAGNQRLTMKHLRDLCADKPKMKIMQAIIFQDTHYKPSNSTKKSQNEPKQQDVPK